MLGTKANLAALECYNSWFMDGTFKVASKLYQQVFTIRASVNNCALALVYVIIRTKTEAEYFKC